MRQVVIVSWEGARTLVPQSACAVIPRALYEKPARKTQTRVGQVSSRLFPLRPKNAGNRDRDRDRARTFELGLDRLRELRTLDHRVEGLLRREYGVKIGHVHGAAHTRLERRLDLLLREPPPVDLVEERVALDLVRAVHPQALRGVARQQAGKDRARGRGDLVWEEERIPQDLFVHLVGDFCVGPRASRASARGRGVVCDARHGWGRTIVKWGKADEHFVQEHTQGPPIDRPVCRAIFSHTSRRGGGRRMAYCTQHRSGSRGRGTPGFRRMCWSYHYPSC